MDVNLINNTSYLLPGSAVYGGKSFESTNREMDFLPGKQDKLSEEVREQVMMNLREVQNFLYMLIGSKLRVQSDGDPIGTSINTAA